jgi:hypothetical protein
MKYTIRWREFKVNKKNLSLELKVCFFIVGWNKEANIKTVDDWINCFYMLYMSEDQDQYLTDKEQELLARKKMLQEFNNLYDFIKEIKPLKNGDKNRRLKMSEKYFYIQYAYEHEVDYNVWRLNTETIFVEASSFKNAQTKIKNMKKHQYDRFKMFIDLTLR